MLNGIVAKVCAHEDLLTKDEKGLLQAVGPNWTYVFRRIHIGSITLREVALVMGRVMAQPAPTPERKRKTDDDASEQADAAKSTMNEDAGSSNTGRNEDVERDEGAGTSTGGDPEPEPKEEEDEGKRKQKNRSKHGRRGREQLGEMPIVVHSDAIPAAGTFCPHCARGKVYKFDPSQFTAVQAQPLFAAAHHVVERLQCNSCKDVFAATLPPELKADGIGTGAMYGYSCKSTAVIVRIPGAMPMHRLETVQMSMGMRVPDSMLSDFCEQVADVAHPVVKALARVAAQAPLFYGDDTTAKIIGLKVEVREDRRSGKLVERTGCHTSCVIAVTADGHKIPVFKVGIQHTGELLDEVLAKRAASLHRPLVMGDASSSNRVFVCDVIMCACNSHAVRKFKDLRKKYPDEVDYVLKRYSSIFKNDRLTRSMSDVERLAFHDQHSRPFFEEIYAYGAKLIDDDKAFEPNSALGKAFAYMSNHRAELGAFLVHPGAPLDNNISERQLRGSVHIRDGAPFFRNTMGAAISAVLQTITMTARLANQNVFDYLNALQRFSDDVAAHPEEWFPWRYRARVDALVKAQQAPSPASEKASQHEQARSG